MDVKRGVLLETGRHESWQKTVSVFASQVYGGLASLSRIGADTSQLWGIPWNQAIFVVFEPQKI